ncbi:DNA-binding CsgD family transcriptional regulator [Catenuloplanes nepalensis]|uniref:DNA-binding CsgD family transcriptional regulator n=1 Tax=Catenuloplanes nepalensis TaxID=587533 RepID=A0ABT9N7F3_9ACTN|nr:LuxR C-terminal-related transcriptional regulator [Catenuloplanes nepalensis]MDP9799622.1 DNA-binding CsgD family transcriptional regulator [Catenuloplanes nepalensis]
MTIRTMTPSWLVLDEQVARICDDLAAEPAGPLRLTLQAPGGYGKSALLSYLDGMLREHDVPVIDAWTDPLDDAGDDAVLLIDDAHLLDEGRLAALHPLLGGRRRLVLAYRPWPRPAGLTSLLTILRRERPPVLLGPFTPEQTARAVHAWTGGTPGGTLADRVHRLSGGVPGIAHRITAALAAGPDLTDTSLLQFRADLDHLDPDVRRLLLATAAGGALPIGVLAELLGRDPAAIDELLEAARATGLLAMDDTLVPAARQAVTALGPVAHRADLWQRLAALQLARGDGTLTVARSLLDAGIGGSGLAPAFQAGAEEALIAAPQVAARLFAAAAANGAPAGARHALATALGGDLDTALRLADRLVGAPGTGPVAENDRAAGAAVAAAVLAHRGQLAHSAERYRWSRTPTSRSFAALAARVTGAALTIEDGPVADGPPTLLTNAAAMMADGIEESIGGTPAAALATLVQAAALLEPAGPAVLLPDSPAALAALVALHDGELDAADAVLDRAVTAGMGSVLMARRHRLLAGWIRMFRGETAAAHDLLDAATTGGAPIQLRDGLFATALQIGLARRTGDLPEMHRGWAAARETVLRHPVDLLTLLPLGELTVAGARLGERAALDVPVRQALDLLDRLGRPPLWHATLHWYLLQAAVVGEDAGTAAVHADALAADAGATAHTAVLAAAARSWCRLLTGDIDPAETVAHARDLARTGLSWDAARLAGQAAARTADRRAMVTLLDTARLLQGRQPGPRADTPSEPTPTGQLSGREQEVAELVLAGLTYKEIGDRLFITPKTVEHHVARMRARLGAPNRAELLARLRATASRKAPE